MGISIFTMAPTCGREEIRDGIKVEGSQGRPAGGGGGGGGMGDDDDEDGAYD